MTLPPNLIHIVLQCEEQMWRKLRNYCDCSEEEQNKNGAGRSQHFFTILCPRAKEMERRRRLCIVSIIFMTPTHLEVCTQSFNTEKFISSPCAVGFRPCSESVQDARCLVLFPPVSHSKTASNLLPVYGSPSRGFQSNTLPGVQLHLHLLKHVKQSVF